ncbi:MAG: hypothetical protein AAFX04_00720 [Pseudomonadota bacterium]
MRPSLVLAPALLGALLAAGLPGPVSVAAQERNAAGEIMVIPELPTAPALSAEGYPDCREDWQKLDPPWERAEAVNQCTATIDAYYNDVLLPFAEAMIAHQTEIARIYSTQVQGNATLTPAVQQRFYAEMRAEHAASEPDGANMADYRIAVAHYEEDRAYLQDRFCFNTGCNGYPVPEYTLPEAQIAEADGKKKKTKSQGCGKARKRGGLLGGLVGGIAGQAAGLDGLETVLVAGASAVLVGEIACQLTREEQEEAVKATEKVTQEERVGATASWQSPTRQGVSGSSTVTELVARPNGGRCMTITDIAIIEGEETRIEKRMCRNPGERAYVLA